jgi:hypothetical protein
MTNGQDGMSLDRNSSASPVTPCRRRHERRRPVRVLVRYFLGLTGACLLGLAAMLATPGRGCAQEPVVYPLAPDAYPRTYGPRHWWCCLTANDGIPRTYSYYYTPWLNQPRHFQVVGPDRRLRWTSTVRGVPMGSQWMTP